MWPCAYRYYAPSIIKVFEELFCVELVIVFYQMLLLNPK